MLMLRTKVDGWLSLSPKVMAESCASEKKLVVADQKKKIECMFTHLFALSSVINLIFPFESSIRQF